LDGSVGVDGGVVDGHFFLKVGGFFFLV
jgi:hypothetical protein